MKSKGWVKGPVTSG